MTDQEVDVRIFFVEEMRAFIAVELPHEAKEGLIHLQDDLRKTRAAVSWVRPEGIHLTIKFLGEIPHSLIPPIEKILLRIAQTIPPFFVEFTGLGLFPPRRPPRVLWVGVREEKGILRKVWSTLEEELNTLGFSLEERGFTPHVTLGRIRSAKNTDDIVRRVEGVKDVGIQGCEIRELALMQSELRPSGALYTKIAALPLGGSRNCSGASTDTAIP